LERVTPPYCGLKKKVFLFGIFFIKGPKGTSLGHSSPKLHLNKPTYCKISPKSFLKVELILKWG
jgi:hypothetical protein